MDNEKCFFSLINLFGYLGPLPTSSRCVSEGEEVLNAGLIITCGILERTWAVIKLFALCLQSSSALMEKPDEIRVTYEVKDNILTVMEAICTCKAGMSRRCKHVAAVLLLSTRENFVYLPTISSEDLNCYWNNAKAFAKYEAVPIQEHNCFVQKNVYEVEPQVAVDGEAVISFLVNALPDSSLAKHIVGNRNKIAEIKSEVLEDLTWTEVQCDVNLGMVNKEEPTYQLCSKEDEKLYQCDECNYKSARKRNLRRHRVIHTGEKPYRCDKCDYKSAKITALVQHKRNHTGETLYGCDQCDYQSDRKRNVDRHKVIHTGEKKSYGCKKCNYKSSEKADLVQHKKNHIGDKPYGCDKCNYKSSRRLDLVRHQKIHMGEIIFL